MTSKDPNHPEYYYKYNFIKMEPSFHRNRLSSLSNSRIVNTNEILNNTLDNNFEKT